MLLKRSKDESATDLSLVFAASLALQTPFSKKEKTGVTHIYIYMERDSTSVAQVIGPICVRYDLGSTYSMTGPSNPTSLNVGFLTTKKTGEKSAPA